MLERVDRAAATLSPSYFALVMATEIVSVGAHLLDVEAVAMALYAFNIAAYIGLWALTIGVLGFPPPGTFVSRAEPPAGARACRSFQSSRRDGAGVAARS